MISEIKLSLIRMFVGWYSEMEPLKKFPGKPKLPSHRSYTVPGNDVTVPESWLSCTRKNCNPGGKGEGKLPVK